MFVTNAHGVYHASSDRLVDQSSSLVRRAFDLYFFFFFFFFLGDVYPNIPEFKFCITSNRAVMLDGTSFFFTSTCSLLLFFLLLFENIEFKILEYLRDTQKFSVTQKSKDRRI